VAYSCSMIVSVLWASINGAWSPWAYEQMDAKNVSGLRSAEKKMMVLWGGLIFFLMLISPELLWIMGGEEYMQAIYVLPPVIAAYAIQAVYSFYNNIELYNKKQKYIAINTTVAAFVNIVLNYFFINKYGYLAAAFTTLIGYLLMLFLHYWVVRRIGQDYWYDTKFNMIFAGVTVIMMLLMMFLYKMPVIRYGITFIVMLVAIFLLFKYKGLVIKYLKKK